MNRLDAMFRDIPRCCICKWRWRWSQERWVITRLGWECPNHCPAKVDIPAVTR